MVQCLSMACRSMVSAWGFFFLMVRSRGVLPSRSVRVSNCAAMVLWDLLLLDGDGVGAESDASTRRRRRKTQKSPRKPRF